MRPVFYHDFLNANIYITSMCPPFDSLDDMVENTVLRIKNSKTHSIAVISYDRLFSLVEFIYCDNLYIEAPISVAHRFYPNNFLFWPYRESDYPSWSNEKRKQFWKNLFKPQFTESQKLEVIKNNEKAKG